GFHYLHYGDQLIIRRLLATRFALVFQYQRGTLVFTVVSHLAVQAVMAFVVVDMPIRMDGLDLAFLGTQLAGVATFLAALEPVEQPYAAGDRQRGAQRADIAAEHLAGEDVDHQQNHRVQHEPPLAIELQGDGGLEGLHLGGLLGHHHRFQRDAEQHQQDDVLDGPQSFMYGKRQLVLGNLQFAGDLVDQLLQCPERAQPATEHAAAPEQDAGGGEGPDDEDHRVAEEQLPAEISEQRMGEGQHVDDRQLPQCIPANEHHGEGQVAGAQPAQEVRVPGEVVLEEQDDGQQQQGDQDHPYLEALLIPDVDPYRAVGLLDGLQFLGGRYRPVDVLLRGFVGQLETGEDAVHRAGLAAYQQLQGPGRAGIECRIFTKDEDGHFLERRSAVGHHVVQPDMVEIAEAVDVAELANLHPVEDAAAHVSRTLERILAT